MENVNYMKFEIYYDKRYYDNTVMFQVGVFLQGWTVVSTRPSRKSELQNCLNEKKSHL